MIWQDARMSINFVVILLVTGFICLIVALSSGCSQLSRLERDIYNRVPAGETISYKIEACWAGQCVSAHADTLSGVFDALAGQVK